MFTDSQRGLFVIKDNKELIVVYFIDKVKNAIIINLLDKVITKTINANNYIILTSPLYITKYKDTILYGTNTFIIQFHMDGIINIFRFIVEKIEKEEYKKLFILRSRIVETKETKGNISGINKTGIKQSIGGGRAKLISSFGFTLFNPSYRI